MNTPYQSSDHPTDKRKVFQRLAGFARVDLVAALVMLGLLAMLTVAAVSPNRVGSQGAACLANLRELTRAWQQFATDVGYFPPNPDDGNTTPGSNWVPGQAGRGGFQEFNPDILKDPTRSLLYPYFFERDVKLFRCPAHLRVGLYQGTDPQKRGTLIPVARSYSMNHAVGRDPYSTAGVFPVGGPWLDNGHTHLRGQTWRTYVRFEDIVAPTPANLVIMVDEDEDSLNDGVFSFGMAAPEWIDWPATRHGMAGTLSFADGRAQIRRWVDDRTAIQNHRVSRRSVPGSADYQWLRERISARIRP